MTNQEALKLVIELAEQNALSTREADTEELQEEAVRQRGAIRKARLLLKKLKD